MTHPSTDLLLCTAPALGAGGAGLVPKVFRVSIARGRATHKKGLPTKGSDTQERFTHKGERHTKNFTQRYASLAKIVWVFDET